MPGKNNEWMIIITLCVPVLIIAIDTTAMDLALHSIALDLGAGISKLQWVVNAYLLAFATPLLTIGAIADRIGRKRVLMTGLILFGISALAGALSTSINMLIASRALLGFAGGMIFPSTLSILTASFHDTKERGQAIGIWAGVFALGAGIGPLAGGILLEYFGWNAIFYLNIPFVVVSLLGIHLFISESRGKSGARPDYPGIILSMSGMFAVVFGITTAGDHGWEAMATLMPIIIGICLLGLFVWWQWRTDSPMLPLELFRNMSFTGASLPLALSLFALMSVFFVFSQYLQSVQGYSPLTAGLMLLPMAAAEFIASLLSPRIAQKTGVKTPVILGILITSAGLFYMFLIATTDTAYTVLLGSMIIISAGLGTAFPSAIDSIMGSLPTGRESIGSGMNETIQQIGGALGVAVLGTVVNGVYRSEVSTLPVMTSIPQAAVETAMQGIQEAHIAAAQFPPPVSLEILTGCKGAFVAGMTEAMFIGAVILAASAVITFIILPSRIQHSA